MTADRHRPRQRAARADRRAAAAAAAVRVADAARPADRHLAAVLAVRVERRAGRRRRALGPVRCGSRSAPSRCAAPAASTTTSSTATSTARSSGPGFGRWRAGGSSVSAAWVLIALLCAIGLGVLLQLNRDRAARRARQHRAGRRLPVHEAHHLVAAGVARPGLLLGRAGRLAGGDRQPRLAGAAAVARHRRLGDRLRHALRDPGRRGRRAGRGEEQRPARSATRRRWAIADLLCAGAAAVGRGGVVGPARLGRAARAAPGGRCISPTRRFAPTRPTGRARSRCSAPTASAGCWCSSACWSSASPAARRRPCFPSKIPAQSAERLVERATAAGADAADALYAGDRSSSVEVRLGELEQVGRSEGEEVGLRRVPRQPLGERVLVRPVRRCARCAGRARAGDGRRGAGRPLCRARAGRPARARRPARPRRARSAASPTPPSFAAARWKPRKRRLASPESPIRPALRPAPRHRPSRLRPRPASPAPIGRPASAARPAWSQARAGRCSATMPGTARAISPTSTRPRRSAASPATRAVARLNPVRPKSGRMPVLFDPRVASTLLGHFAGAINGVVGRAQVELPSGQARRAACSRAGVTIVDDPLRRRGLRSRPFDGEGVRVARMDIVADGVLHTWMADSASARQLGIAPTGHAVARRRRLARRQPEQFLHRRRAAQPRGAARRHFPRRSWSPS